MSAGAASSAGGGIAALLMYVSYAHAKEAGLESCEPGTET